MNATAWRNLRAMRAPSRERTWPELMTMVSLGLAVFAMGEYVYLKECGASMTGDCHGVRDIVRYGGVCSLW
jgi:hypothetical protein